jgi:signal transduction histidine kinase
LPEVIKLELKNARKYSEGRGLRIEVKSAKDVENIRKLVEIKVKN